ncbi:outer membrane beta-barrel protein [Lewinella sp. IMCC34191]|uniref:outer membrane beta-barrel protein n=1 Tax=Lewinella sp. IMCC34191 TaxID=2259172 RepID=UPI000E2553E9|nr:outer membrane beta-barrel protein [Lewinella sp. IMCC34191]
MHTKTYLLLALWLAAAAQIFGQSTRRGLYLDGGASLLDYTRTDYPYFGHYLSPARPQRRVEEWAADLAPVGYFVTDRLLVGTRFDLRRMKAEMPWTADQQFRYTDTWSALRPFLRYYPLASGDRKWSVFGEVGFGRIGLEGYTGFETDFHLAAGTEYRLGEGLLATARLAYNGYASDLNYTTLEIGPRILINELHGVSGRPRLTRGTLMTRGPLFRGSVGHMRRQEQDWLDYRFEISPSVGYFPVNGLAVVAEVDWQIDGEYNYLEDNNWFRRTANHVTADFRASLGLRYYPIRSSRLLPFAGAFLGHYRYEYDYEHPQGDDTRVKALTYRGTVGGTYFLSDRVALEANLSYTRQDERMHWGYMPAGSWSDQETDRLVATAGFTVFPGRDR